jgi:hypothetical protein
MENDMTFQNSTDFTYSREDAVAYITNRASDAAELLSTMQWQPGNVTGVLQCKIYGHSILWDVSFNLHAGDHRGLYEVLWRGGDDVDCFLTLEQVVATILARNW